MENLCLKDNNKWCKCNLLLSGKILLKFYDDGKIIYKYRFVIVINISCAKFQKILVHWTDECE